MKKIVLWISLILLCTGCTNQGDKSGNEKAISAQLNRLFNSYAKSGENLYDRPVPQGLFTDSLKTLLEKAVKTSEDDMERVKNSEYPDDKPLLLEGSVFTSLYEGFTSYRIRKIMISNVSKDKAESIVEFQNAASAPKAVWTDHVLLVKDSGGWKIDNIIFGDNPDLKDLRSNLENFNAEARQP